VKEALPAEPEPMDYKAAINKHNGTKLLHNNQDPFQGHVITQEDNQQKITPGSIFGLSAHGTKTQQEANLRGESQGTKSPDTKPQSTHMASKTTTLLETLLNTPGVAGCERDEDVGEGIRTHQPRSLPRPSGGHTSLHPERGERSLAGCEMGTQSIRRGLPRLDLLGIVPGHYLLQANNTAEVLCALVQTDLHSQFYKSAPASETKVPGFSLGRDRVTKNQARSATRLQALEAKQKEVNDAVSSTGPTPTLRFTQSPKQGKIPEEDEVDEDETTYDPVENRIKVPPRYSSHFYSNGNPKPISTRRLLIGEPKSRQAKRPGKRGKGRGGRRFRGSTSHNLREPSFSYGRNYSPNRISEADLPSRLLGDPSPSYGPNPSLSQNECATPQTHMFPRPKTTDSDKTATAPVHVSKIDRVKMIIFSFIKYVTSLTTKKGIYYEHTHDAHQNVGEDGIEPPFQHDSTESRDHPAEWEFKTGAACFEPSTALLLQNPMDQETYDPDQALSRSVDQMKYRDTTTSPKTRV